MVRAGGLFILVMGVGVVLGSVVPTLRRSLLAAAVVLATASIVVFGPALSASMGGPTPTQLWFLVGAIALEALFIGLAVAKYRRAGERALLLAILFAVGLHFLPMAGAFGPICAALGVTLCVTAGYGLWLRPSLQLNGLWLVDGLLKATFGAIMLFSPNVGI
jgi:hypothetical protein